MVEMGQAQPAGEQGHENDEPESDDEPDDAGDEEEDIDMDAFRDVFINLLDQQVVEGHGPRRRRTIRRPLPMQPLPVQPLEVETRTWGCADDKNVQVVADALLTFGGADGRPLMFVERGLARLVAEYAVEYLPRFARMPPRVAMRGLPLGDIMYDAIFGSTPNDHMPNNRRTPAAQLIYDHVNVGSCGWFERCTDASRTSAFGHFVVVWKHPSPRARVVGIVFPYVSSPDRPAQAVAAQNPTLSQQPTITASIRPPGVTATQLPLGHTVTAPAEGAGARVESVVPVDAEGRQVFGADLLTFAGSEAAACAVEQRRCTCGVRAGRYFMSAHLAPCAVRSECKRQTAALFARTAELERAPADGFYRVHYLRYPRRFWVQSRIDHLDKCVGIVHSMREQLCRFGVQPRKDRPVVGPAQMMPGPTSPNIFDILPERLQSSPFSITREQLASLGVDRPSPLNRRRRPLSPPIPKRLRSV